MLLRLCKEYLCVHYAPFNNSLDHYLYRVGTSDVNVYVQGAKPHATSI